VAWQATCQFVGQAFGFILGHIIFIILESKQVSNKYIRPFFNLPLQNEGIITLKSESNAKFYFSVTKLFLKFSKLQCLWSLLDLYSL